MQARTTFAEANQRKFPEQIAIAIAREPDGGKCNPISLGWSMQASHEPPMLVISIGKTRHSLGVIRSAGAFVLAFPSAGQARDVEIFGTQSGRDADKLVVAGTQTEPAEKIDSVLMTHAVANFECKVVSETDAGDHVLFLGEVVACHVNRRPVERLYTIGAGRMAPVTPSQIQ